MGNNTTDRIADEAARYGFMRIQDRGEDGKIKWKWLIHCAGCVARFSHFWSPATPVDLMVKNMRTRHWTIGLGDRPLCPTCTTSNKDLSPKLRITANAPQKPVNFDEIAVGLKGSASSLPVLQPSLKTVFDMKELPHGTFKSFEEIASHAQEQEMIDKVSDKLKSQAHVEAGRKGGLARARNHTREELSAMAGVKGKKLGRPPKGPEPLGTERLPSLDIQEAIETADRLKAVAKSNQETPDMPIAASPPTKEFIAPGPRLTREIFRVLDVEFDGQTHLYRNGYTDARVAAECGTTEQSVAYLRKEAFGELAEDPRITSLRDDLELVKLELASITEKLNAIAGEKRV